MSRHFEYLAQAGVASVISLYPLETTDEWKGVPGDWISSADETALCESLGMKSIAFDFNDTFTASAFKTVSDAILALPKPIYFHCHVGYSAALFAQLHMVRASSSDDETFYNDTLGLGWNYQADADAVALVSAVAGIEVPVTEPSIELDLADGESSYRTFYWPHRVGRTDGFYNTGQVLETQVAAIALAGFKSVISFRSPGEPTMRVPSDPTEGPVDNDEFSDENGNWDGDAERASFEAAGLFWFSAPVSSGGDVFTAGSLDKYTAVLDEALARGAVLTHCTSGFRSAAYALAYRGRLDGHCSAWATEAMAEIGFTLEENDPSTSAVIVFFVESLGC